jgi:cholesterol 7-dehydrogenase
MGANLGIGGKVKWNSCIECPFHGWTFDGKTGKPVNSEYLDDKCTTFHTYNDIKEMTKNEKGKFISECENR